jgi:hypothetical protein
LRELQRAIIYTNKRSKQVTKSHVRDAVHMYLVNWGAMLTTNNALPGRRFLRVVVHHIPHFPGKVRQLIP